MSQRYLGGVITANPTAPTMTTESGVWTLEQQFQYSNVWSPKIVGNSVRLRSSASAYFNRTPASASNQKTWTWSGWVKRGALGTNQTFFNAGNNGFVVRFNTTTDYLEVYNYSGAYQLQIITSQVFRDPSAWYHIVVVLDTTQATSSNRAKVYVNGSQVTSFGTATYPSQNADLLVNGVNTHAIGVLNSVGQYFDGYLAEVNFIDGQALTPSSFGAYDTNGVWQPLAYTGTFGTNGFYVDFSDNSGTTATTLGKDYSGNGNNWTPNNFSLTTGATYDWMLDTPTNSDNGGTGRGNYAVLNPLGGVASAYLPTNGNLRCYTANGVVNWTPLVATIALQSNFYAEVSPSQVDTYWTLEFGITPKVDPTGNTSMGQSGYGICLQQAYNGAGNTTVRQNSASSYTFGGGNWSTSDTFMVAYEASTGKVYFGRNGTWYNSGVPASGTGFVGTIDTTVTQYFAVGFGAGGFNVNFGQRPFAYTPPTGFKALNTQNLPTPTITKGNEAMGITLYTGNGSTQLVNTSFYTSNSGGQPDFIWLKSRSAATNNGLFDSNRGWAKALYSNATSAEVATAGVGGVDSANFSLGGDGAFNTNAATYVAWQWKAGQGVTSSNTSGSITSTTSVNATAGFSVVTYTSTTGTVGHGLGVAPDMIIMKARNNVDQWTVGHKSLNGGSSPWNYGIPLNTTAATQTNSGFWNNTAPTSTVFSQGSWDSGFTKVAYCFAAVAGYSAFGSYTGNGSADGPFVYCGFRPRFVMIKCTGGTTLNWRIQDSSRDPYNQTSHSLYPNLANAEATADTINFDFLSNGFKLRSADGESNGNGSTYIYAVFAENPFNISRAR